MPEIFSKSLVDDMRRIDNSPSVEEQNQDFPEKQNVPPNGGLWAWLQVLAGFVAFMNSFGILNSFSVFQSYYKTTLIPDSSDSAISWIGSIQGCLVVSSSFVTGRICDAGYHRELTFGSVIIACFCIMMMSLSTKYYQLLLATGILMGFSLSGLFVGPVSLISTYFTTKKGIATGIIVSGSSVGAIIYPIMMNKLIIQIGFPWASRIMGFIVLATGLLGALLIKTRVPPRRSGPFVSKGIFVDPVFVLCAFGQMFALMGTYIPIFYIQPYGKKVGLSENLQLYIAAILATGSILGRVIPNALADRIGALNTFAPILLFSSIACFSWISVHNTAGVVVFAVVYGFLSGGTVSLPSMTQISIADDLSEIGTRMGVSFVLAGLGLLAGSPIAGALLERENGNYIGMQVFAGSALMVGCFSMTAARLIMTRRRSSVWV